LLSDESIDSDKWQEKLKPKKGAQETKINNGSVLFNKLLKHQNLNDSILSVARKQPKQSLKN